MTDQDIDRTMNHFQMMTDDAMKEMKKQMEMVRDGTHPSHPSDENKVGYFINIPKEQYKKLCLIQSDGKNESGEDIASAINIAINEFIEKRP